MIETVLQALARERQHELLAQAEGIRLVNEAREGSRRHRRFPFRGRVPGRIDPLPASRPFASPADAGEPDGEETPTAA